MTTGYAYDPIEQIHNQPGHVENNRRTAEALARLREKGLLDLLPQIPIQPIQREQLLRVHLPDYLDRVQEMDARGGGMLDYETYMVPGSLQAALMSAGAGIALTRAVLQGQIRNGMSVMRPPGHHALPAEAMGYCIFANAALAARAAQIEMGLERILIIDWDVHHGNGTEAIFYDDPSVAFVSFHQYPLYPGTGAATDIGAGPGLGTTLNIPMPPGVGDIGYWRAFDELVVPFAHRFQPELIIVSSGYDVHWRDPLSQMNMTLMGYAQLARRAVALAEALCDGRLVVLLEGGYDIPAVGYGVLNTVLALLGETEFQDPLGPPPNPETDATDRIQELRAIHNL